MGNDINCDPRNVNWKLIDERSLPAPKKVKIYLMLSKKEVAVTYGLFITGITAGVAALVLLCMEKFTGGGILAALSMGSFYLGYHLHKVFSEIKGENFNGCPILMGLLKGYYYSMEDVVGEGDPLYEDPNYNRY